MNQNKKDKIKTLLEFPNGIVEKWKNWHYKNTSFLILSLILFVFFIDSPIIQNFIKGIGALGYFGAFICGVLFVSIFTVAPSIAILFDISTHLNPWLITFIASIGVVVGNFIIFKFLKDRIFEELHPVFLKIEGTFLKKIFRSPFFVWLLPILGAILIATPLADEVGITLLGLSKVKLWQFILIIFPLGFIAIFSIVFLAGAKI